MLNIFKYKDTIQTMWEIDVLSNYYISQTSSLDSKSLRKWTRLKQIISTNILSNYYSKLDKLFTLMFFEEVMMNWNIHNLMSQSHLVLQGKLLWSL